MHDAGYTSLHACVNGKAYGSETELEPQATSRKFSIFSSHYSDNQHYLLWHTWFFDCIIMIRTSLDSVTTMSFNAQIALKIHQKALAAGALPRTPLGELTTLFQIPLSAKESPPSFVHFKHCMVLLC
jgi:hypothetical protein